MFYPYRSDYKCPDCKIGTMKWQGEEFHSTYVLGRSYCDNPKCQNSREHFLKTFFNPQSNQEAK